MQILKEKTFYSFRKTEADKDIAFAILEDGTWLLVHNNGTASAPDGAVYYHVGREVESAPYEPDPSLLPEDPDVQPIPGTLLEDLGWTTDAKSPMFFPLHAEEPVESTIL